MAHKLGLVDPDTGLAAPVGDAGYAVAATDTPEAARAELGIGSVATLPVTAVATSEEGALARAAYDRPDWRDAGVVAVDGEGRLPAVGGQQLTRLPAPYAPVGAASQVINNSVTPAVVASLTVAGGKITDDGQRFHFFHAGRYLNNAGPANGFLLEILLGGVVIWSGDTAPTHFNSASNPRLLSVDLVFDRRSATTAQMRGHIAVSPSSATTLGTLISSDSRTDVIAAPVFGEPLLAWDFSQDVEIAIRMTLSSALSPHTYTSGRTDGYCDRNAVVSVDPPPTGLTLDWLEDFPTYAPTTIQATRRPANTGYPLLMTGSLKLLTLSAEQLSLFDASFSKLADVARTLVAASQALNPNQMHMRVWSPVALQSYADAPGTTGSGIPFDALGATTALAGGVVFPGHFLYRGGRALLVSGTSATDTAWTVSSASNLSAGGYAIVRPAGSWWPAEMVYISAVTASTGAITVRRAHKSPGSAHAVGEIVQMVQLMAGTSPEGFGCNLSSVCPVDGAGKKFNQILAEIMALRYDTTGTGGVLPCHVDGILSDSDWRYIYHLGTTENADTNGDGTADHGIDLATGVNVWGAGLAEWSQNLRAALDARGHVNAQVATGDIKALNQELAAGCQFEGFLQVYDETGKGVENYDYFGRDLSAMKVAMAVSTVGDQLWDMQLKNGTAAYPGEGTATSNSPFRLGLATALLVGSGISCQNYVTAFKWWDEYAVSLAPGTYGRAVAHTDIAGMRAARHWMGSPLGKARRLYGSEFEAVNSLVVNGDFDTDLTGWSGEGATLSRVSTEHLTGTHALQVAMTLPLTTHVQSGAWVAGPSVPLVSGEQYTLCFAVKSAEHRIIMPRMTGATIAKGLYVPGGSQWSRHVWTFRAPANSSESFRLQCGGIGGTFYLDQVRLFRANADVFRRDFENAIVLVNATPSPRTIALGGTFQRILGTGQDPVNDGSTVTSVTVPAWDAAILVRPEV